MKRIMLLILILVLPLMFFAQSSNVPANDKNIKQGKSIVKNTQKKKEAHPVNNNQKQPAKASEKSAKSTAVSK